MPLHIIGRSWVWPLNAVSAPTIPVDLLSEMRLAVPFKPKGYVDLQNIVHWAVGIRFPELFPAGTILEAARFFELKKKRHTIPAGIVPLPRSLLSTSRPLAPRPAPAQNIYPKTVPLSPDEKNEFADLLRREQERAVAHSGFLVELHQALGDGEVTSFLILGGSITPMPCEFWRLPLGLQFLRQPPLAAQLDRKGQATWGVLVPVGSIEKWLKKPEATRTRRKKIPDEILSKELETYCTSEWRRTGFPPKRDAAVEWLQEKTGCDRTTARRIQGKLPDQLRRSKGKPVLKSGKQTRQ